jgi:hypothetical protein
MEKTDILSFTKERGIGSIWLLAHICDKHGMLPLSADSKSFPRFENKVDKTEIERKIASGALCMAWDRLACLHQLWWTALEVQIKPPKNHQWLGMVNFSKVTRLTLRNCPDTKNWQTIMEELSDS